MRAGSMSISTWPMPACSLRTTESRPRRLADAQVPATMLEFLQGGASAMDAARHAFDFVAQGCLPRGPSGETIIYQRPMFISSRLCPTRLAPRFHRLRIPLPPRRNGEANRFLRWYKAPVYYKGNHRTIVGPDYSLPWPLNTQKLDYEWSCPSLDATASMCRNATRRNTLPATRS